MKKLSVITINYNNREGLRKTIESVVGQTYRNFEYIIIDGGSSDGSVDVIRKYEDRISFWVSEPDKGIYNAMNKGILKATGEYCNFMNSGDCFHSNNVLENIFPFYNEDIIAGKFVKGSLSYPWGHPYSTITMLDLVKGTLCHQATFIKRQLFVNHLYCEDLKIASDWKFFVETLIFENCTFRNIDIIVADFDDTGASYSNPVLTLNEREKVLREFLPEKVYIDYVRFAKADSPILELTPILNNTYRFQKFIYNLIAFLIKVYFFIKKIRDFFTDLKS